MCGHIFIWITTRRLPHVTPQSPTTPKRARRSADPNTATVYAHSWQQSEVRETGGLRGVRGARSTHKRRNATQQ